MKMNRSLLLGSAAGFVAVAGAQAADLPVKAKPVEYVKICTLYGEGYYYIPGSDTCLKFGGYIRASYGWNVASTTPAYSGTQGAQDRTTSRYSTTQRANMQIDTRTQTDYGTLRTFTSLHMDQTSAGIAVTPARAFIQWAGFTIGHAQSFADTFAIGDSYHYVQQQNNADTAANGINQLAYTWELGNGATLSVGGDEPRRKTLINVSNLASIGVGREALNTYAGVTWPDAHIDFKLNQAWGYWATSVVAHDVSASYYTCTGQAISNAAPTTGCGHPENRVGWAILTGAEFKMDFISPGDRFGMGVRYAQGASNFGGGSNLSSPGLFGSGNNVAVGFMSDAIFTGGTAYSGNPLQACNIAGSAVTGTLPFVGTQGITCNQSQLQLTTTWTVGAVYEHLWTPNLKTSLGGTYSSVEYNSTAKAMFAQNVCAPVGLVSAGVITSGGQGQFNGGVQFPTKSTITQVTQQGSGTTTGGILSIANNCDPDWGFFQGHIRTQWNPSRGFLMGIDVSYTHVFTAFKGQQANLQNVAFGASSGNANVVEPIVGARPNGIYNLKNLGIISIVARAQRNFNAGE